MRANSQAAPAHELVGIDRIGVQGRPPVEVGEHVERGGVGLEQSGQRSAGRGDGDDRPQQISRRPVIRSASSGSAATSRSTASRTTAGAAERSIASSSSVVAARVTAVSLAARPRSCSRP